MPASSVKGSHDQEIINLRFLWFLQVSGESAAKAANSAGGGAGGCEAAGGRRVCFCRARGTDPSSEDSPQDAVLLSSRLVTTNVSSFEGAPGPAGGQGAGVCASEEGGEGAEEHRVAQTAPDCR